MPKRKTTRAGSRKPKPKLPAGNDDNLPTDIDKKAKLDMFLRDFDEHVKIKIQKMDSDRKKVLQMIEKNFIVELQQMPEVIKKMTLKEFIAKGGDMVKVISECEGETESLTNVNPVETMRMQRQRTFSASATRALSRINMGFDVMETIPDGEVSTVKSLRTKSKITGSRNRKNTMSENMPPPPSPHSTLKSKLRTPANKGLPAFGWDTPLVTPKFDPRLPLTPAQARTARPGEMMLSLGGSPVHNPYTKADVRLRGQTLTVNLDTDIEIPDEIDLDHLPLKEKVAQLINVLSKIQNQEM